MKKAQVVKNKPLEKILVIPDQHFNINCNRAWKLLLLVAKQLKPDIIVILGDMLDLADISRYSKDANIVAKVHEEISSGKQALDELTKVCKPYRKVFIEGNHEERLNTYKNDKAEALANLINPIDELLGLEERGWEFVKYKHSIKIGRCKFSHFFGHSGDISVKKALEDGQGYSMVFGHTHALSYLTKRTDDGRVAQSITCGWGGDFKSIDYRHQIKTKGYVQGCVIGYLFSSGTVQFVPVPFQRGSCVIEGKLISI